MSATQIVTYRYRVKNLHGELKRMSRAVNFVWNYCNDVQKHALKWDKKWPSYFGLTKVTYGSSKHVGLLCSTIEQVCKTYVKSRRQHRKPYLRYRGKKNLGWVPFRSENMKYENGQFLFNGKKYQAWMSRELPNGRIVDGGSFSQDANGNWYLNIPFEIEIKEAKKNSELVGIDLGLKDLAVLSNGEKIEAPRIFRALEHKLAIAQRAGHKKKTQRIHAKIRAQRHDFLHKASADIAKRFGFIAVGHVSSSKLAKTKMAKSVNDAGWSSFRNMLAYKSIRNGAEYTEVNEAYSSQSCSNCGVIPDSRPVGIAGLEIREWICSSCGCSHDRDVNAAINILRWGQTTLVVGAVKKRNCQEAIATTKSERKVA